MKRSKLLGELRTLIHCQQKAGFEAPEKVAERILLLVEGAGMLPPKFEMEEDGSWGDIHDVKDWYCLEGDFKWEPEDGKD